MIPTDLNYDYENCRCGHNGLNHGWRDPTGGYRCTVPKCGCSLFSPLLSPEEIRARDEVLRSDPREFVEVKTESQAHNEDPEAEFSQGPYSFEIRKTFERARPILEELFGQCPDLDRRLILDCLKEQTLRALQWKTPEDRKKAAAWKKLWKALDEFRSVAFQTPTLEQLKDTFKFQQKKGVKLDRTAQEMWGEFYKKWPPYFEYLRQTHNLPMPEAVGEKGRPKAWWFDVQARRLRDHFEEKMGSPKGEVIESLLNCAPPVPGISMKWEDIRRRLGKWKRDKQAWHIMALSGVR